MSVFVHLSLSIHYNSILTDEHFPSMAYRPKSNLKHHFGASTEVKVNLNIGIVQTGMLQPITFIF